MSHLIVLGEIDFDLRLTVSFSCLTVGLNVWKDLFCEKYPGLCNLCSMNCKNECVKFVKGLPDFSEDEYLKNLFAKTDNSSFLHFQKTCFCLLHFISTKLMLGGLD